MKWLDLPTIKAHLRITEDYEDELLTLYGNSAEETMQQYLGRTYEDIIEEYSSVPVNIKHASLMLVDAAYKHRAPMSPENMNLVPYTFDVLVKPYVRL